ncbi:TPA: DUF2955 domain-containing protein [Candidatus Bathyarchaeota archaeon]|nr:DUF2955 domain-containing protein [Candidatus Bathyarchaeota archaeon]
MTNQPPVTPEPRPQEEAVKPGSMMPAWERRARVTYSLVIFGWLAAAAIFFSDYIIHYPLPFMPLVFALPLIMCLYLISGRRGWFGAITILLLSSLIFFGVLPAFLALFVGTSGLGLIDRYLDWAVGIDQGGGLLFLLTARAALILSAGIFLVIARLLQHPKTGSFRGKNGFRMVVVGALLLPILLTMMTSSGETNADPAVVPPVGTSYGGAENMLTPDINQITRVFDGATGTWTYTIFLSNPSPVELTITQVWAGRDAIAPFSERVEVVGSGVRISGAGIVFEAGSGGTIRFITTRGHNNVVILTGDGARYTINWTEQF